LTRRRQYGDEPSDDASTRSRPASHCGAQSAGHQRVLAGDIDTITSQWTDDFVVLPPAGPVVRGRAANAAIAEAGRAQIQAIEPVEYVVELEEITVAGEYAFEWGTFRSCMRTRDGGQMMSSSGKLMRILQRQPDGSWKMHRTMMTSDPSGSTDR
jgi:ketosteroid isomerase-like protein